MSIFNQLAWVGLIILMLIPAGCTVHDRSGIAPPAESYTQFSPVGVPKDVRVYGDFDEIDSSDIAREFRAGLTQRKTTAGLNVLALSGGGQYGAYGAGVLNGWSREGSRPKFDFVTGISTGAIIAPFAFLGSKYDETLRRFYTTTNTKRVAQSRILPALIGGGSLARSTPLEDAISRELSDEVLRLIGEEHKKGRRLFVGTTNFDAERPVVWDLGYIASLGTQEGNDLARRVVLASASIPVVFNPVPISVTDGVIVREELHVDGALTQPVFTYPYKFDMRRFLAETGLSKRKNTIWLIYNQRLEPVYQAQDTRLLSMVERTLGTLTRSQSLAELSFVLTLAQRDGLVVNGLAVPRDFQAQSQETFDPVYMTKLFERGFEDGAARDAWYYGLQDEFTAE